MQLTPATSEVDLTQGQQAGFWRLLAKGTDYAFYFADTCKAANRLRIDLTGNRDVESANMMYRERCESALTYCKLCGAELPANYSRRICGKCQYKKKRSNPKRWAGWLEWQRNTWKRKNHNRKD